MPTGVALSRMSQSLCVVLARPAASTPRKGRAYRARQVGGTLGCHIPQRERGDPRLRERHRHRARDAAGADHVHALAGRVDTMAPQGADIAQPVEHVADPAPVGHPARRVDGAHPPAVLAQLVDVCAHGLLVRHGEHQPVAVAQPLEPRDRGREAGGVHLGRHHHRVDAMLGEQCIHPFGRARLRERVAEDRIQPCRAADHAASRQTASFGTSIQRRCAQLCCASSASCTPLAPSSRFQRNSPAPATCARNSSHCALNALS